jgi:DNA-binding MarR family transcriptional regulator
MSASTRDRSTSAPAAPHPPSTPAGIGSHCLCLKTQRAARVLARRFDAAFRPLGLTNGQFSLLAAAQGMRAAPIGRLADFLAMDRTSLTAALKPLERAGLLRIDRSDEDARARIVRITAEGSARLAAALPVWRETHAALDAELGETTARLRADLAGLAAPPLTPRAGAPRPRA